MKPPRPPNPLREAIIARVLELGLTAEELSEKCGGKPSAQHLNDYLTFRAGMRYGPLERLVNVLGLKPLPTRTT